MYNRQSWPQKINLTSQATDGDYIVTSGMYSAGSIPLNGVGAIAGNYINAVAPFVTVASDADDSVTVFTIIFKDSAGRPYTYTFNGPDTGSITLQIPVYQLLEGNLTIATASVGNLTIGVTLGATVWVPFDQNRTQFNDAIIIDASSAADLTYTVEYTADDALRTVPTNIIPDATLASVAVVSGSPAQKTTALPYTIFYARVRLNAWTDGSLTSQFITSGSYPSWKNY